MWIVKREEKQFVAQFSELNICMHYCQTLHRVDINSLIVKVDAEENEKVFPEQTKLLIFN